MTMRSAGATTVVDLLGAISATATTVTDTTKAVGRLAQAGLAKADAFAAGVEAQSNADKAVAGVNAKDVAALRVYEQRIEIQKKLGNSKTNIETFNAIKAELFPS